MALAGLLAFLVGIGLAYLIWKSSFWYRFLSREPLPRLGRLGSSAARGALMGLLFLGLLLVLGLLDSSFKWSLEGIVTMVALSLVLALVVAVGSYWRSCIVGGYQDALHRRLRTSQRSAPLLKNHPDKRS